MNKEGQVGMDTAKAVMMALLILGVIAFAMIIAFTNLNDTTVARTSSGSFGVENETIAPVNETGVNLFPATFADSSCTVTQVLAQNNTAGILFDITGTTNVSLSDGNCRVAFGTTTNVEDIKNLNNSAWNVTYSYTHNVFAPISQNVTAGTADFFGNASTWFALLAVVIIILIIFAVNRFGGKQGGL